MRILHTVSGPVPRAGAGADEPRHRDEVLYDRTDEGTSADVRDAERGPASIESVREEHLAIPTTAKAMPQAE